MKYVQSLKINKASVSLETLRELAVFFSNFTSDKDEGAEVDFSFSLSDDRAFEFKRDEIDEFMRTLRLQISGCSLDSLVFKRRSQGVNFTFLFRGSSNSVKINIDSADERVFNDAKNRMLGYFRSDSLNRFSTSVYMVLFVFIVVSLAVVLRAAGVIVPTVATVYGGMLLFVFAFFACASICAKYYPELLIINEAGNGLNGRSFKRDIKYLMGTFAATILVPVILQLVGAG